MTKRYVHPAAEQKKLAAASLESFRINGLIEAASEQAVGTNMGTVAQVSVVQTGQNVLPVTGGRGFQWVSGRLGEAPAYAGTDFIIVRDGGLLRFILFRQSTLRWTLQSRHTRKSIVKVCATGSTDGL